MTIFKYDTSSCRTVKGMLDYALDREKADPRSIHYFNVVRDPYNEFMFTNIMFREFNPPNREYYQFIISLSKDDVAPDTFERFDKAVWTIADILSRWCDMGASKFHVVSVIHTDKAPEYDAHIIVNSVSFTDGHMFPWDKRLTWLLRNLANRILIYFGFTPIPDKRLNELSRIPPIDYASVSPYYRNQLAPSGKVSPAHSPGVR